MSNLKGAVDKLIHDTNVLETFTGQLNASGTSNQTCANLEEENASTLEILALPIEYPPRMKIISTNKINQTKNFMHESGCELVSPRNRSTLGPREDSEEPHLLKVTCWVVEHRWERDACQVALQVDERRALQPVPWSAESLAARSAAVAGPILQRCWVRWPVV
jgi:hypothetical protein